MLRDFGCAFERHGTEIGRCVTHRRQTKPIRPVLDG